MPEEKGSGIKGEEEEEGKQRIKITDKVQFVLIKYEC